MAANVDANLLLAISSHMKADSAVGKLLHLDRITLEQLLNFCVFEVPSKKMLEEGDGVLEVCHPLLPRRLSKLPLPLAK